MNSFLQKSLNASTKSFSRLVAVGLVGALSSLNTQAQFVVHNNGAEVTVNQGCIVTIVTGDLNNDDGTIDNAGRITVEGDLTNGDLITGAGVSTGIFNVSGDWINNAVFTSDQSLVNLNGANQLVTGSQVTSFHNLNLLGSGIKTLDLNADVTGILELNNLELATETNLLRVLNGSSAAITENGGFVSSLGAGRISWSMNSTDTYVFPLGSSVGTNRIRPLSLTPATSTPNTFAARFANTDATNEGFDVAQANPDLCTVNDQFFYLIEQTAGSDAVDITQSFVLADDGDWTNGAHWQGAPQWEDMTNEVAGTNGVYTTVTNPAWNDFSEPAFALAVPLPEVSIDAVAPLCESADPIALNASPVGGSYFGAGVSNGMFDPSAVGEGSYTISYTYTDGLTGCTNMAEIEIEVEDAPIVTITSSNNGALELCDGESLDLTASTGFVDYTWLPSGTGETITVTTGGQYSVTATDANGCESTSAIANVTVQQNPEPVITSNGNTIFCEGESILLSTAPNQGTYDWEITGDITPTSVVTESGDYFVTVTNAFGCVGVSNTISIDVTPMDDAFITADGNDLTVDPPGTGYQWFLNGDPIPGANDIDYTAIQSGNYHVEYIGPNGCPTSTPVLEFTVQVGIDELGLFDALNVYPNPGKGEFVINGQLSTVEDVTIELTNMLGQALQPAIVIGGATQFTQPMDISKYANGVYFIRIQAANSTVTVRYIKS
jgi:hypothetical protein